METVYIALGSNVGDRHAHLRTALERLALVPGVEVARVSPWLETDFVGDGPAQPRFLNGVAELRSALTPAALHAVLQQLEVAAGRRHPHPPNHPRELDLDVLFFGDRRIDTRALRVPHPRWHEREFVLRPLRELGLDPDALPRFRAPTLLDRRDELLDCCGEWLAGGCTIGLVPTMGSLHEGHRSLMEIARDQCDRVLATVFVNPLQFGPNEDFAAYPRDLDGDLAVCRDAGVDVLFAPSQEQMFPTDFASHVAVGREAEGMEGACRPGHFAGVATVVARLFAMVRPHRAYFGEKDAQQLAVLRRMTRELGFPVQVVPCPTVREPDGLARSSRNVYLCADDRRAARVLYRALTSARERFRQGLRDRDRLLQHVREVLAGEPRCQVDYVELRREGDLAEMPPGDVAGGRVLVAGRFTAGERPVRLLDNLSLVPRDEP